MNGSVDADADCVNNQPRSATSAHNCANNKCDDANDDPPGKNSQLPLLNLFGKAPLRSPHTDPFEVRYRKDNLD